MEVRTLEFLWQALLEMASGVPAAVVLAALAFLSKGFLNNLLKKDLEKYKAELDHTHDLHMSALLQQHEIAVLQLDNKLVEERARNELRFSHLHDRQFNSITCVYGILLEMLWSLERITNPGAPNDPDYRATELSKFDASLETLNPELNKKRILLPREVADETRAVAHKLANIADTIRLSPDSAYDQFSKIRDEVKPSLDSLTDKYRALVGAD